MKIYDISQEIFESEVYPGDPLPQKKMIETIDSGSMCNVTAFSMCAHTGTHIDAPKHFYNDGRTIDEIDLDKVIGKCYVTYGKGDIGKDEAYVIMHKAMSVNKEAARRILLGGDITVTIEGARVFKEMGVVLIGNESASVGPLMAPAEVHYELLKEEIVLLEGIRLRGVNEGVYILNAAPLNLGGSDGAPCRAVLIDMYND